MSESVLLRRSRWGCAGMGCLFESHFMILRMFYLSIYLCLLRYQELWCVQPRPQSFGTPSLEAHEFKS